MLSLKKQDGDVGGFQCVPELFSNFDEWVKTQPDDRDPMHPDTTGLKIVNIDMEAGDFLIWNSLLAHGVRPNHSEDRVRMAQYISMYPAEWENIAERESASACGANAIIRSGTPSPAILASGKSEMRKPPNSRRSAGSFWVSSAGSAATSHHITRTLPSGFDRICSGLATWVSRP